MILNEHAIFPSLKSFNASFFSSLLIRSSECAVQQTPFYLKFAAFSHAAHILQSLFVHTA